MLFRPAESSKRIVEFYRNYLLTTFKTNNPNYNRQLEQHLSDPKNLAKGPYINLTDPFMKDKSIQQLVEEGTLSRLFLKFSEFYPQRPLYKHQVESIRKAIEKKNLIITTGTGSGKTECFLIPVFNHLLREREKGTLRPGIRTMIIYPMNALVNDQIRRLRKIFRNSGIDDITFGRFTGETLEYENQARNEYISLEKEEPIKNELISREQMRNTPPHILITNYAMLEYLLLRPGDNIIFNKDTAHLWQTIVFDEAHTYGGAKGIEVSTLIKRVKAMLGRDDIQFILTSATLGDKKENQKIIDFASKLCSAPFDQDSIIRSQTTPPERPKRFLNIDFSIYRQLAQNIRENVNPTENLKLLKNNGIRIIESSDLDKSFEESLYEMIRHDGLYHQVRKYLLNNTMLISELATKLNLKEDDVTDFITVASNAEKNGDKIFEARYHMFIKGLEGVYVTLKPSNKLFIHKMETYIEDDRIDDIGYKVYEISFCHNCHAIYLSGQVIKGHFIQKSRFSEDYSPDIYLLEGDYDIEDEDLEHKRYHLCSKCGAIGPYTALNPICEHDPINYNMVIKVKDHTEKIHACPCCHVTNTHYSIVRPFYLGNEAATAVIATALYKELPNVSVTRKVEVYQDPFFNITVHNEVRPEERISKHFLVFSDSRQSAAYFATYLENTYNSSLYKRIMTKVSEELTTGMQVGLSLNRFVEEVKNLLVEHQIVEEGMEDKEAWILVLQELINFKARNALQNKGILYFDLDFEIPGPLLDLSYDETVDFIKYFIQDLIRAGAVSYPISLTRADENRLAYVVKRFSKDYVKNIYIESWLPNGEKENKRTRRLLKFFPNMNLKERIQLLRSIWELLIRTECLIYQQDGCKISWDKFKVKAVHNLYKCTTCHTITPYNVRNICPNHRCSGQLVEYDFKQIGKKDHYYRLYRELPLDKMVVREHTAQLGSKKAGDYQSEFINEKINVLSCSTTFEMGVDVGTLETVFMRNMPPSPANYAQRAGRAGRSKKAAAYSITFCPNNSHDLHYFSNPVSMIRGSIHAPALNVNNEKIMQRHIFASAIAFFWKQNPKFYQTNIGNFFELDGYHALKDYLTRKPADLKAYLKEIVTAELSPLFGIESFEWVKRLFSEDKFNPGVFTIAFNKYQADLLELENALERYRQEIGNYNKEKSGKNVGYKIDEVNRSIQTLKEQNTIEFLSRNNIIPKYGFPVDTVELTTYNAGGKVKDLQLVRDLTMAISEYAPESEIVADGQLITSRYVRVLRNYSWPKYNFVYCPQCNMLNRTLWTETELKECKQCGTKLPERIQQYIVPKFGFLMDLDGPKNVGIKKPERTYRGSISYIGDENKIEFREYIINGHKVLLGTSHMDELAVLNTSNFYICETCGYGMLADNNCYDRIIKKSHRNSKGYRCENTKLKPLKLGHEFQTDVAIIKFVDQNIENPDKAWTILYSLLEGLSRYLSIERSEIAGTLTWYKNEYLGNVENYGFVLFDHTPGGAGYVRELRDQTVFEQMLKQGYHVVASCNCGGKAMDTACYSCLCNYYNQKQHDILKRKYAIEFYQAILFKEGIFTDLSNGLSKFEATYNYDGQNQSTMSFNDVWNYIAFDTEDDSEKRIFEILKELTYDSIHHKPYYDGSITIIQTKETVFPNLIWPEQKVMLFLKENEVEYVKSLKTDWNSFITDQTFDIELFLRLIGGQTNNGDHDTCRTERCSNQ